MRDSKRIDRIIDKLRTAWYSSPDLRFGQLIDILVESYVQRSVYRRHLLQVEDEEMGEALSLFLEGHGISESPACVTAASAVNSLNKLIDDPEKRQVIEDLFAMGVPGEVFDEDPRVFVHEEADGRLLLTVLGLLNLLFPPVVIEGKEHGAISSVYELDFMEEGSEELGANLVNFQETTLELLKKTGPRKQELSPDKINAVIKRFKEDIARTAEPHGELVVLESGGWEELMSMCGISSFTHEDFPGVVVDWKVGSGNPLVRLQIFIPVKSES